MTEQQTQLVIAAQNGDIRSFEQLFAIYYEKVYALARMILRNADAPEGPELTTAQMDALWQRNAGYWTSTLYATPEDHAVPTDDKFIGFFKDGAHFKFEYGLLQTSYWFAGEATKAIAPSPNAFILTLLIPAAPATDISDARPERTDAVYIHEVDNRINIKIANLGDGEWYSYIYGGNTLEEAYENR